MKNWVRVSCPKCDKRIKIASEMAGKHGKCPRCEYRLLIDQKLFGEPADVIVAEPVKPVNPLKIGLIILSIAVAGGFLMSVVISVVILLSVDMDAIMTANAERAKERNVEAEKKEAEESAKPEEPAKVVLEKKVWINRLLGDHFLVYSNGRIEMNLAGEKRSLLRLGESYSKKIDGYLGSYKKNAKYVMVNYYTQPSNWQGKTQGYNGSLRYAQNEEGEWGWYGQ